MSVSETLSSFFLRGQEKEVEVCSSESFLACRNAAEILGKQTIEVEVDFRFRHIAE